MNDIRGAQVLYTLRKTCCYEDRYLMSGVVCTKNPIPSHPVLSYLKSFMCYCY